jgi:hypothetical protein
MPQFLRHFFWFFGQIVYFCTSLIQSILYFMKKQRFYIALWAFMAVFAYGCKEKEATPPSAEFSISYKNIKEPLRAPMIVEFTAKEDGASYQWGGYVGVSVAGSSSSKNVSVKFTASGTPPFKPYELRTRKHTRKYSIYQLCADSSHRGARASTLGRG